MYLSEILWSSAAGKNSPSRVVEFFCSSGCSVEVFLSIGRIMFVKFYFMYLLFSFHFTSSHQKKNINITPKNNSLKTISCLALSNSLTFFKFSSKLTLSSFFDCEATKQQ